MSENFRSGLPAFGETNKATCEKISVDCTYPSGSEPYWMYQTS